MKLYRYLDQDFGTQLIRDGKIRLGTFKKYQKMELEESDLVRGDKDDGYKRIKIDKYIYDGNDAPPVIEMLTGTKTPHLGITLKNVKLSFGSANILVLCLSKTLSVALAQRFNATECIRINEPDLFFHTITKTLCKMHEGTFTFLGIHECRYVPSRDFSYTDPMAHVIEHAKIKTEKHSVEEEVRAMWSYDTGSLEYEHLDLVCPKLSRDCSLLNFQVHAGNGWSQVVIW